MSSLPELKRPRDAAATQEAILEAARIAFTLKGYERVGVREIAGAAGVNASLVNRYFGSKEGLFAKALNSAFDFTPILTGERSSFGERVARYLVTKREDRTRIDPMLVLLRSAASAEAAAILRQDIDEFVSKPLAAWLGGPSATEQAGLIVSLMAGFDLMRNVIASHALSSANEERLISVFATILQSCVDTPMKS